VARTESYTCPVLEPAIDGFTPAAPSDEAAVPAPELTVILPVRNGAASIGRQLDAVLAQQWDRPWEVLVVDNDSTDATPEIVADYVLRDPRVRVVTARRKHGLSHARNVGVERARSPAVVFCDDDDLVGDGFVAAMGDALRDHPIVACRLDWSTLNDQQGVIDVGRFQSSGIEQLFGYPLAAGVGGWQRGLWLELGGNDEALTSGGEDFDMSIRAHVEHGVSPYFEEEAVYRVARRSGFRATFHQARRYGVAHVQLYARHGRGRVRPRDELRAAVRVWLSLVWHADDLLSAQRRVRWARRAGLRVGRLEQSVRSRTLLL
jgi:glycosyltransferase involved in cell wall biosynthesis